LITVVVYWTFMAREDLTSFSGLQWFHLCTVHVVPSVAFMLNWQVTDIVLSEEHNSKMIWLGLVYLLVNFLETKIRG